MIDVPSNLIWIVGFVLLVIALAFLWNLKLSNHASEAQHYEHPPEMSHPVNEVRRYKGMPVLAPAPPPVEIILEAETIAAEEEIKPDESETDKLNDVPDCEDAERMLSLAWKLEVNGDFEGRDEFAGMVVEKPDASPRQRDRAHAMLRRDSMA
ncbi:membrane protein [Pseudomonas veronii 1YdBTEX2]|uniref:Membrane protein n=1 Tax=Pseudomonas veronii 1YdBTEX2 TaxID=1295141 RepID=A0A1D3K7F3_PSEVE|nr:hypothetical protein [Pseudomonas sp. AP19]OEC65665.1 hypothetical protein A7D21_32810 [Pseudomonas sp. AP19]SBW84269.1 membrane protein [Pseudomonas veronii 1YdBTEX2]